MKISEDETLVKHRELDRRKKPATGAKKSKRESGDSLRGNARQEGIVVKKNMKICQTEWARE